MAAEFAPFTADHERDAMRRVAAQEYALLISDLPSIIKS
jgi:hypothetical protein